MSSPAPSAIAPSTPSAADLQPVRFAFDNTYARLPEHFYARVNPLPVTAPRLIKLNTELALSLGLDPAALASQHGIEILAGNRVADGSEPIALAYAGHQFGHFVPQLGDGRANLLGEVIAQNGQRYDIQLKGSGPTPFSRRGDGRAALGPVLREYILSEAMAALGIPTTRALAAVGTGDRVLRESILPGAVFTRVAASHLRVGTFEYFAARNDTDAIRTLADFAIARHYPEAAHAPHPYRTLLDGVISRHAALVAQWLLIGFIHGVMNTDNTSISGETIDYGPCAFMEAYNPAQVFSSIDRQGRYAYANQPHAAFWNLTRLAESLLPILEQESGSEQAALDAANESLAAFAPQFEAAHAAGLRAKLGLTTEQDGDRTLAQDLLDLMAAQEADFTQTFRRLADAAANPADTSVRSLFADPTAYDAWAIRWRNRLAHESSSPEARASAMRRVNPAFIPRNHLVEETIAAAIMRNDFAPFEQLVDATSRPYDYHPESARPELARYTLPARPEERVQATFCGT